MEGFDHKIYNLMETFNPFMHNIVKWPNIMHERVNFVRRTQQKHLLENL